MQSYTKLIIYNNTTERNCSMVLFSIRMELLPL